VGRLVKRRIGLWKVHGSVAHDTRINAKLGGINSDAYLELMRQFAKAPYMVCDEDLLQLAFPIYGHFGC
jgi:hypothetical protein